MIKHRGIKNNDRNTSYYKSQIEKAKKPKKENFFDYSRRRQMNSYIRAVAVVSAFMLVTTGFIMLGIFLRSLTAEEYEQSFAVAAEQQHEGAALYIIPGEEPPAEPCGVAEIFYNFRGAYLDVRQLECLDGLQAFIDMIQARDINAVVIDIKKPDGVIPFRVNGHFTAIVGEHNKIDLRIQDILEMLRAHGIYVSGRIACFRDGLASAGYLMHGALIESATGMRFADAGGSYWLNIYSRYARNHVLHLIQESVLLGFDEIVLSYFYLPGAPGLAYDDGGVSRSSAVSGFVAEARELVRGLSPHGRLGLSFPVNNLMNMPNEAMGLEPGELAGVSDFFVTNFAPSHLPPGTLGISDPESEPYTTVRALAERLGDISGQTMLRPYIQAFDGAGGVAYGDVQISAQRQALWESGITVWTLVNYDNEY